MDWLCLRAAVEAACEKVCAGLELFWEMQLWLTLHSASSFSGCVIEECVAVQLYWV